MPPSASSALPFGLSQQQHQHLAQHLPVTFKRWKQQRSGLETLWGDCWDAYNSKAQDATQLPKGMPLGEAAMISRPVIYEAVETIHTNLMSALFPIGSQFFSVLADDPLHQPQATQLEKHLANQLAEAGFEQAFALFIKQAIVTGSSIACVPWRTITKPCQQAVPTKVLGHTVGHQWQSSHKTLYDGPAFDVLNLSDVVLDPQASHFDDALLIRKLTRTLGQLEAAGCYANLEQVRQHLGHGQFTKSLQPATLTLYEAWGDLEVDGTLYPNHVAVVAETGHVIRFEANPFAHGCKPFVFTSFIPVPNQLYGLGAVEKCLGLHHAINTLTNQKLDVIALSINNPFTYLVNDDVFDPDTLVTHPGAMIPVKSHDTLKPIQYLNNYTVAFNEIADLKAEIQEATGAFKYFTGASTGNALAGRSATEVSALVEGGARKYNHLLSHIERSSLEPFLRQAFDLWRQFGQAPAGCDKAMSAGEVAKLKTLACRFKVAGAKTAALHQQQLAAMLQFFSLVSNSPEVKAQVDVVALAKRIYRTLGFADEEEVFSPKN